MSAIVADGGVRAETPGQFDLAALLTIGDNARFWRVIRVLDSAQSGYMPRDYDEWFLADVDWVRDRYLQRKTQVWDFQLAFNIARTEWVAWYLAGRPEGDDAPEVFCLTVPDDDEAEQLSGFSSFNVMRWLLAASMILIVMAIALLAFYIYFGR